MSTPWRRNLFLSAALGAHRARVLDAAHRWMSYRYPLYRTHYTTDTYSNKTICGLNEKHNLILQTMFKCAIDKQRTLCIWIAGKERSLGCFAGVAPFTHCEGTGLPCLLNEEYLLYSLHGVPVRFSSNFRWILPGEVLVLSQRRSTISVFSPCVSSETGSCCCCCCWRPSPESDQHNPGNTVHVPVNEL